jgi:protein ImuB
MQLGGTPMRNMPELYACLYAKEFPAQALLRLRPDIGSQACVVLEGEPPQQTVCSMNARARVAGAEHGMTRVEIDTLPPLHILTRAQQQEATAKTALLECAGGFSSRVEDRSIDNAFIAVIDIAGTDSLFGPPEQLGKTLLSRVRALGVSAVLAVSGNFHAAISLAKGLSSRSRIHVIPYGREQETLAALPLSVLDLSGAHAETFDLWGINNFGMLANLPEKELVARMGQEGRRLRQLARGEAPHLFQPVEPPFALEERIELDSPVELLDSLMFVAGVMVEQLILRASSRIVALASVTIMLSLERGESHSRTVRPALPNNDRQLWLKLLHLDLEAHPPKAAILSLRLTAEPGHTSKVQLGLFSPQLPEPGRLDVTLAQIAKIVGEGNVGRAVLQDTHHPQGFRMERFTVPSDEPREVPTISSSAVLRVLRPPEGVQLTLNRQTPDRFRFRLENYVVECAFGPWAARGEWWNARTWGREQWDLVARGGDGSVLYGCLTRDVILNRWQMVGLYD